MEPDDGPEEEGPFSPWLPPDDRLWRHPSEAPANHGANPPEESQSGQATDKPLLRSRFRGPATRLWSVAVIAGVIGAVAASGIGMMTGVFQRQTTVVHSVIGAGPTETLASEAGPGADWTSVDDSIAPSVVDIDVSTPSGPTSGSGFLFAPGNRESYVITDSSLVANATDIRVTFDAGDQYHARLVGQDPMSGVALIAVPTWEHSFPTLGSVASLQFANRCWRSGPDRVRLGVPGLGDRRRPVRRRHRRHHHAKPDRGQRLPPATLGRRRAARRRLGRVVGITLNLSPVNSCRPGPDVRRPGGRGEHVAQQLLDGDAVTHPWLGVTSSSDITTGVAAQYGVAGRSPDRAGLPGQPGQPARPVRQRHHHRLRQRSQ